MNSEPQPNAEAPDASVSNTTLAMDGLLRELARGGSGADEAFVRRVITAAGGLAGTPAPRHDQPPVRRFRVFRARTPVLVRALAAACVAFALLCVGIHVTTSRGPRMTTVLNRETAYRKVAALKLGAYLAEKYPGARSLVIVQPTPRGGRLQPNPLVDGLKAGFGTRIAVVAEIAPKIPETARARFLAELPRTPGQEELPSPAGDVIPPMEFWFTPAVFDEMVAPYGGKVDLIVTTIGLPQEPGGMAFWAATPRPKLALLGGSVYKLRQTIRDGLITAAVTYSPKAVYEEKAPPADPEAAFARRFILITPDNVDRVATEFGELFPRGDRP